MRNYCIPLRRMISQNGCAVTYRKNNMQSHVKPDRKLGYAAIAATIIPHSSLLIPH